MQGTSPGQVHDTQDGGSGGLFSQVDFKIGEGILGVNFWLTPAYAQEEKMKEKQVPTQ